MIEIMKQRFLVLFFLMSLSVTKVMGQAIYNIQYEFVEYTESYQDQGTCQVLLEFNDAPKILFGQDLAGYTASGIYTFPASATMKTESSHIRDAIKLRKQFL